MTLIRAPYILAELKKRSWPDESILTKIVQPGYQIDEKKLQALAEKIGVEVSELAPAPEMVANRRFKNKMRGGLSSFLFEYDGCFRHAKGSNHAEKLGIEQDDDIGLPSRASDAMLLEKTLNQVIDRAKYMLSKIDNKFVRSEHAIEFREQLAFGIFKPKYRGNRFKAASASDLPIIVIEGRQFNNVASIARAYGLDPLKMRRRIVSTGKTADKLSIDEWNHILSKQQSQREPFTYQKKTYSSLAEFCREHQLNTVLVYKKTKERAGIADAGFWELIIKTCQRKI